MNLQHQEKQFMILAQSICNNSWFWHKLFATMILAQTIFNNDSGTNNLQQWFLHKQIATMISAQTICNNDSGTNKLQQWFWHKFLAKYAFMQFHSFRCSLAWLSLCSCIEEDIFSTWALGRQISYSRHEGIKLLHGTNKTMCAKDFCVIQNEQKKIMIPSLILIEFQLSIHFAVCKVSSRDYDFDGPVLQRITLL